MSTFAGVKCPDLTPAIPQYPHQHHLQISVQKVTMPFSRKLFWPAIGPPAGSYCHHLLGASDGQLDCGWIHHLGSLLGQFTLHHTRANAQEMPMDPPQGHSRCSSAQPVILGRFSGSAFVHSRHGYDAQQIPMGPRLVSLQRWPHQPCCQGCSFGCSGSIQGMAPATAASPGLFQLNDVTQTSVRAGRELASAGAYESVSTDVSLLMFFGFLQCSLLPQLLDMLLASCGCGVGQQVCPQCESCSVMSDSLQPHGLYNPQNSPGQNTGVGSLSLLQGIFPTQISCIAGGFFVS